MYCANTKLSLSLSLLNHKDTFKQTFKTYLLFYLALSCLMYPALFFFFWKNSKTTALQIHPQNIFIHFQHTEVLTLGQKSWVKLQCLTSSKKKGKHVEAVTIFLWKLSHITLRPRWNKRDSFSSIESVPGGVSLLGQLIPFVVMGFRQDGGTHSLPSLEHRKSKSACAFPSNTGVVAMKRNMSLLTSLLFAQLPGV